MCQLPAMMPESKFWYRMILVVLDWEQWVKLFAVWMRWRGVHAGNVILRDRKSVV